MYTLVLNIVKTIIFTYLYRRMSQLELYSNKCNPFQATPTIYRFLISSLKIMEHISGKTFRIFFSPVLSLFKPAQVSLGSPNARIAYQCPPGCQFLPPPPLPMPTTNCGLMGDGRLRDSARAADQKAASNDAWNVLCTLCV